MEERESGIKRWSTISVVNDQKLHITKEQKLHITKRRQ